ncbi:unnamed protein product [Leuciscus chuanchicus]
MYTTLLRSTPGESLLHCLQEIGVCIATWACPGLRHAGHTTCGSLVAIVENSHSLGQVCEDFRLDDFFNDILQGDNAKNFVEGVAFSFVVNPLDYCQSSPLTRHLTKSTALLTSFTIQWEGNSLLGSALIPNEGLTGWKNGPNRNLDHINTPNPSQVLIKTGEERF